MSAAGRLGVALLAAAAIAGTARADVFEVADDGAVLVRAGAAVAPAFVITAGFQDSATSTDATDEEPAPDVPSPALTLLGAPTAPATFQARLQAAAAHYAVSPDLLAALVWQESRWQPAALSHKGAIGLAQLMPATARALAVDPRDAGANLDGAAHYLRQLLDLFDGDVERALAAYNAGPARVLKAGGVPPIVETRAYVSGIIDRLAAARAPASQGGTQ